MINEHFQRALPFSSDSQLSEIGNKFGTPLLVHDENSYIHYGKEALAAPNAFGLTVRYAMKANSHRVILNIFNNLGIEIDASSYFEVKRALAAGIAPEKILLTSQETLAPSHLQEIVELGVLYNCTSIRQLNLFAELFADSSYPVSVRINPGLGSGYNNRTNTGGIAASFGIWHIYVPEILNIVGRHSLKISRLHTHIGSGSDWQIWQKAAQLTLDIVRKLPDVDTVNLGGGYKIDRMKPENSINMASVFSVVKEYFLNFEKKTGRRLHLEIEPGSYLAANSCLLLARVNDIADTGPGGYRFLKLDASMTELLRPMIYGARHPIRLIGKGEKVKVPYVIVGSCCESGDIFTPKEGNPEEIDTELLPVAKTGNFITVFGTGAYGISMSSKNYNSHPVCAEVMIRSNGSYDLITRRQEVEEIWDRELSL